MSKTKVNKAYYDMQRGGVAMVESILAVIYMHKQDEDMNIDTLMGSLESVRQTQQAELDNMEVEDE